MAVNSWFTCFRPRPEAHLRLICFPHAGGGASLFRAWSAALPEAVEVVAVQLPGRETRFREKPMTDLAALADTLVENLLPNLDRPFAFFGHSMGALLAFEVARRCRTGYQLHPEHLFASACAAPQRCRVERPIHRLPDGEFLAELRQLNGTPRAVLDNEELLELLLPMLRADFALCETYTHAPGLPLPCPITALGGRDDCSTPPGQLHAWREQTTAAFNLRLLPGDHFFVNTSSHQLLRTLAQELLFQRASPWAAEIKREEETDPLILN